MDCLPGWEPTGSVDKGEQKLEIGVKLIFRKWSPLHEVFRQRRKLVPIKLHVRSCGRSTRFNSLRKLQSPGQELRYLTRKDSNKITDEFH